MFLIKFYFVIGILFLIGLNDTISYSQTTTYTCDVVQLIRNSKLVKSVVYNVEITVNNSQVKFISKDRTSLFNIVQVVTKGETIEEGKKYDVWEIKNTQENLYFGLVYDKNGVVVIMTSTVQNTKEELWYRVIKVIK